MEERGITKGIAERIKELHEETVNVTRIGDKYTIYCTIPFFRINVTCNSWEIEPNTY